jgi:hypothetical protein
MRFRRYVGYAFFLAAVCGRPANTNPVPPPNVILSQGDDPALPNITFTYEGSTPILGTADIFGFEAHSTNLLSNNALKDAVGLSTNVSGGSVSSVNLVLAPGTPAPVPGRKLYLRARA